MSKNNRFYSIYLSPSAVELREIQDEAHQKARLVCSQSNYQNAFEFAVKLANDRSLFFRNFVPPDKQI